MSLCAVGTAGYLYTPSSRRPFLANSSEMMGQARYFYVGARKGARVIHHLFRSINGGYLVAVTNRDFFTGDVIFSGTPQKKPKPRKKKK